MHLQNIKVWCPSKNHAPKCPEQSIHFPPSLLIFVLSGLGHCCTNAHNTIIVENYIASARLHKVSWPITYFIHILWWSVAAISSLGRPSQCKKKRGGCNSVQAFDWRPEDPTTRLAKRDRAVLCELQPIAVLWASPLLQPSATLIHGNLIPSHIALHSVAKDEKPRGLHLPTCSALNRPSLVYATWNQRRSDRRPDRPTAEP